MHERRTLKFLKFLKDFKVRTDEMLQCIVVVPNITSVILRDLWIDSLRHAVPESPVHPRH